MALNSKLLSVLVFNSKVLPVAANNNSSIIISMVFLESESWRLERTSRAHLVQPISKSSSKLDQVWPCPILNVPRNRNYTVSLGKPFQCFATVFSGRIIRKNNYICMLKLIWIVLPGFFSEKQEI